MKKGRATIRPEKVKIIEDTIKLVNEYPVVGLIDLNNLPAAALQSVKMKLADRAKIKVIRKRLLKFALEKSKKELLEHMPEQPAIIFTKENPFKIYNFIQKNKSPIPAKPGDVPEDDVIVNAGPTDLMPGPALTTLSSVRIKAKVEGGKIAILNDVIVCEAGKEISEKLAGVLSMLKMKPMKIAPNIVTMIENETTYMSDVLFIDDAKTLADITQAVQEGINLAVEANYPTSDTIEILITKAFNEAKSLGVEANIMEKDIIGDILAKAVREAKTLEALVPEPKPAEEKKEEPKVEEKKDDSKKEGGEKND